MPLQRIADDCGLCVLLVAHPVKHAGAGDPLSEIAHASAVSQVARSAFWVTPDPEHGDDPAANPHRLVSQVKANLSPFGATSRFELVPTYLPGNGVEPAMTTIRAIPAGESLLTYREIRKLERREGEDTSKAAQAQAWLVAYLTEHGPTAKPDVVKAAEDAGIASRTLERAAELICDTLYDPPRPALWWLPSSSPSGPPVGIVGELGELMEESRIGNAPACARPSSPSSPTTDTAQDWRTDDEGLVW